MPKTKSLSNMTDAIRSDIETDAIEKFGFTKREVERMTRLEFLQVSRRYFKSRLKEKRSKKEIHNLKFALAGAERELVFLSTHNKEPKCLI